MKIHDSPGRAWQESLGRALSSRHQRQKLNTAGNALRPRGLRHHVVRDKLPGNADVHLQSRGRAA
jgi:hypothetical protein